MKQSHRITTTRRQFLKLSAAGAAAGTLMPRRSVNAAPSGQNVLFIAVDDLRPQLACYGNGLVHTPNIDALAAGGVTFTRSYCQQAVCNPSRASVMTGLRPDTLRVYDLVTHFRSTVPDAVTLPQHFKNNGYHTQGLSKIYHGTLHDDVSWSAPWWGPNLTDKNLERAGVTPPPDKRGPAWRSLDLSDEALPDGKTARAACDLLGQLREKPFFLAVGLLKPHLPFVAPKRYFDLYPPDKIKTAPNPFAPAGVPPVALTNFGELRHYTPVPDTGPVPEDQARDLVRAYCACVSYMDAQVGLLLRRLEELGLHERTTVILWGDHGYQLGEHGLWCKHTNFEDATRAPLIVRAPGRQAAGAKTNGLVEFVDIYPSLCELAGLPVPQGLEGASFAPLMNSPDKLWKKAAFSQYPRKIEGVGDIMGYSMRTDQYRYTEWRGLQKDFLARELYDHKTDPAENTNLADLPVNAELVAKLGRQLKDGWKAALPT